MHNFVEDCHIFNFSHTIEVSVYALFYVSFLYLSLKLYSFHHMGFYYTFLISIIPRFFYLLLSVINRVFLFPIISFNQFRLVYRNVNVLIYLYFIWSLKLPLLILSFSKLLFSPSGSQTVNCLLIYFVSLSWLFSGVRTHHLLRSAVWGRFVSSAHNQIPSVRWVLFCSSDYLLPSLLCFLKFSTLWGIKMYNSQWAVPPGLFFGPVYISFWRSYFGTVSPAISYPGS